MNQNKTSFCKALAGIRERVVKADGFLSGGSRFKFDVSDIDVTKTWRSMQHMVENHTAAGALRLLMDDAQVGKVAAILCMNTADSNEALARRIDAQCDVFGGSSLLVVREARAAGLDLRKAINTLRDKVFGAYVVRGVPFGPQMRDLVSQACMISARADCESPVSEMGDAEVLDALTMAHGASTPKELERAVEVLKRLDPSVRSNGSSSSVKGHVTRIAHRYWFQRGICPEFMRETIARLIVKVANATSISDEDYMHMEFLYRSAAILCSMCFGSGAKIGFRQVMDATRLHKDFVEAVDAHGDAYVSLTFLERFGEDFEDFSSMFDDALTYARAADAGVDADDRNSVIVNQPVTRKVGNATVHTGQRLASQGSLFDILDKDAETGDESPFDSLSK